MTRWVVFCCAGIVALDFVEPAIARGIGVSVMWFAPVQIGVYFALGFVARRRWVLLSNALGIVGVTALAEAVVSSAVAVLTTPGWPHDVRSAVSAVIFAVVMYFVIGAAGIAFASMRHARALR